MAQNDGASFSVDWLIEELDLLWDVNTWNIKTFLYPDEQSIYFCPIRCKTKDWF
jgi:hypothetical protein